MKNLFNRHDVAMFIKVFFVMSVALFIFACAFNVFLFHTGWNNVLCHYVTRPIGGYRGDDYVRIIWQAIPFFVFCFGIRPVVFEFFRHKKTRAKMDKALKDSTNSFKTLAIAFFFLCGASSSFAQAPGASQAELFSKQRNLEKGKGYTDYEAAGGTVWEDNNTIFQTAFWLKNYKLEMITIWFDDDVDGAYKASIHYAEQIAIKGEHNATIRKNDSQKGYFITWENVPVFAYWKDVRGGRVFCFEIP